MPANNIDRPRDFPLFTDLPVEIQDLIWDIAARPFGDNRQLHTFFAVDHYFDLENKNTKPGGDPLRFGPGGTLKKSSFNILVPWDNPDGHANTSAYKANSGLWTACRASRKALEKRYPRNEWWSRPASESGCVPGRAVPGEYLEHPDASHTASYIDRNGAVRHITISPGKDVVCFAFPESGDADWFYHYAGDHIPLLDQRDPEGHPAPRPSFVGMDVAIEFESKWFAWLPRYLVDVVVVFHDNTGRKVWFIDRRLRRRQSVPGWPVDLQTFYSCGYVFTEVREDHQHLWEMDAESSGEPSVFDFFHPLAQMHNGGLEAEGSTRLGVLACEPDPRW